MFSLNCKGRLFTYETPIVMGIVNVTHDSFYEGSRRPGVEQASEQAIRMLNEGAAIIDVGGQSTRPGAELLSPNQEMDRVLPVVQYILQQHPDALLSVDTFYSSVAKAAVEAGASIINDISSGEMDEEMISTVARAGVPYIAMHMKGTPATMQSLAQYNDVTVEVLDYFVQKVDALHRAGIHDVIIDPGFGFAKTPQHNLKLLRELTALAIVGKPILAGLSRKSTVYKTLGLTPEQALNGTTVLNTIALLNGASILRVHDVKEALEAVKLTQALKLA